MFDYMHKNCGGDIRSLNNDGLWCEECQEWVGNENELVYNLNPISEKDIEVIANRTLLIGKETNLIPKSNQSFHLSNCDNPTCSICWPQEDFTNYNDIDGYCMTNHNEDYMENVG